MQKQKIIVISAVLVDVIGFGIVIPILPFYVTEFGASPTTITFLFATFSFFSFLNAPLLGMRYLFRYANGLSASILLENSILFLYSGF